MTSVNLCAACAGRGQTCCQGSDRDIYVTPGDVKRIQEFNGNVDFFEYRKPTNLLYMENADDPNWASCIYRPDGSRRVIKREATGDCWFLTTVGCQLPLQVRPLICRLYPFEYNEFGYYPELSNGCPITLLDHELTLLEALDIEKEEVDSWHKTLYQEILLEKQNDDNRINL